MKTRFAAEDLIGDLNFSTQRTFNRHPKISGVIKILLEMEMN